MHKQVRTKEEYTENVGELAKLFIGDEPFRVDLRLWTPWLPRWDDDQQWVQAQDEFWDYVRGDRDFEKDYPDLKMSHADLTLGGESEYPAPGWNSVEKMAIETDCEPDYFLFRFDTEKNTPQAWHQMWQVLKYMESALNCCQPDAWKGEGLSHLDHQAARLLCLEGVTYLGAERVGGHQRSLTATYAGHYHS